MVRNSMVRQRVTFQRRVDSQDDSGQLSLTWEDVYTVGAMITKQANTESSNASREISYSAYNIKVPYSPSSTALTTRDSVVFSGTRYSIEAVDTTSDWRKSVMIFVSQRNMENA